MSLLGTHHHKPHFIRALPVYIINLVLLLLSTRVVEFVSIQNVHVVLFLIPLFYWVVYQPSVMPLWFVFLAGLVVDFSLDAVLGLHAFGFVLFYMVLYNIRRIILSQPLLYQMFIFAMGVFGFELLRWVLASLLLWPAFPFFPAFLGFVLNLVAFFPVVLVLKTLHRVMSGHGGAL